MTDLPETLLAKILLLVQDIQTTLIDMNARLTSLEGKVNGIVNDAFPEADLVGHRRWHERRRYSAFKRWLMGPDR